MSEDLREIFCPYCDRVTPHRVTMKKISRRVWVCMICGKPIRVEEEDD